MFRPMPLIRRRGSMFIIRKGVPERLRPIIGKREIVRSLDTRDPAEAKRRVPCIHIRGGNGRRVKNRGSERLIPLHPELIRLGFMTYVAQQRGAGETRLFPELKPDRNGKLHGRHGLDHTPPIRSTIHRSALTAIP